MKWFMVDVFGGDGKWSAWSTRSRDELLGGAVANGRMVLHMGDRAAVAAAANVPKDHVRVRPCDALEVEAIERGEL